MSADSSADSAAPAVRPLPVPDALRLGDGTRGDNAWPGREPTRTGRWAPSAVPPPPVQQHFHGAPGPRAIAAVEPPPLPAHGTARVVTPPSPQGELPAEGALPAWRLTDSPRRRPRELPNITTHPLVLGLLLSTSLLSSVTILLVDFGGTSEHRATSAEAREQLRAFYEVQGSPLQPYQAELRLAQQAHSRGNREAEIAHYRNVLARLREENRSIYTGLTGSPTRDSQLEQVLSILLAEEKARY